MLLDGDHERVTSVGPIPATYARSHDAEVRAEVGRSLGQLDDGLEVVEPVAGVVAAAAEDHAVHAAAGLAPDRASACSASVSWISPPRPGAVLRSTSKTGGCEHVAADDGEVARRLRRRSGFSTRPVTRRRPPRRSGSTAAQPYR